MQSFSAQMNAIAQHQPSKTRGRRYLVRAAVCLVLRETDSGAEVLMMRRADKKGDPWSGHMAFPGGKADKKDESTYHTALRELEEEAGFTGAEKILNDVGRLSDVITRPHSGNRPMVVTPFVFTLDSEIDFSPNHEVAELVWIPLEFLSNIAHREKMKWHSRGVEVTLPCYFYEGRRIWGLSLSMLDELVYLMYRQRFGDSHSRMQFRPRFRLPKRVNNWFQ